MSKKKLGVHKKIMQLNFSPLTLLNDYELTSQVSYYTYDEMTRIIKAATVVIVVNSLFNMLEK